MLKVGIITIPDFNNYGNRLQNFALQELFKKIECNSVSYVPFKPNYIKKLIRTLFGIGYKGSLNEKNKKLKRLKAFIDFDNKYVNTKVVGDTNYPNNLSDECDFFVSGSDQIWNPKWYTKYAFLDFVHNKTKFAYAASFGCDAIPKELVDVYKNFFDSYDTITVREKTGKLIMKETFNIDVNVVPDPTLGLTSDEWRAVEHKPDFVIPTNTPYVLLYFLGGIDSDRQVQIDSLCKQKGINLYVNLLDVFENKAYEGGPSEFLYLIDHADLVLTDSFHACVFSILFHKEFVVFERLGKGMAMMNRIDTLLERFHLEQCKYSDVYMFNTIDYSGIDSICSEERQYVLEVLEMMKKKVEANES